MLASVAGDGTATACGGYGARGSWGRFAAREGGELGSRLCCSAFANPPFVEVGLSNGAAEVFRARMGGLVSCLPDRDTCVIKGFVVSYL